jgi:hypothetical protein
VPGKLLGARFSRVQRRPPASNTGVVCPSCHHEIAAGTERTILDKVKGCVRVCALCAVFFTSAFFGPISPAQAPPPILITLGAVAPATNTAAVTTTTIFNRKSG